LKKETPVSAVDAMLTSLTLSTISQYSRPLKLWWQFCQQNRENSFFPSTVLDFLGFRSYSSLNEYNSSLNTYSSAISLISSADIGSHPLIKRFFKGVAALKPPRPRYDFTWDPSSVILYLARLYPYSTLSLELISKKLVTLFALTTAQRMQTLAAIQRSNIVIADSVIIRIPARLKTSGIGRAQPMLVFKPFLEKPELCLFSLINLYLERTADFRRLNCDAFFISYCKPYSSVSSQTLGRWVKSVLEASGIDVSIFSHSTRHASTSLAASRGININEIRRTAGWSKSSDVFARFYNRPI
ncbi:hypothetical protein EAI_04706, partial [Harpegnathos saltator]